MTGLVKKPTEIIDLPEGYSKFLRLSADLKKAFPDTKGFSSRNLKYMRKLASLYPGIKFVQQAVALIPWGHIVRLMELVKDAKEREWYIYQTLIYLEKMKQWL